MIKLQIPCPYCCEQIGHLEFYKEIDIENSFVFMEKDGDKIMLNRDSEQDKILENTAYFCPKCNKRIFKDEYELKKYIMATGNKREPSKDSLKDLEMKG